MSLFNGQSTHEYGQSAIRSAVMRIEAIEFENFEERSSSTIEAAVAKLAISTPQLHVENKTGKRLTEERMVEDYGRRVTRNVDYIDVTIPFTGDDTAFVLSPSTRTLGTPGEINRSRNAVVIRFPDNERLEQDLATAISQIQRNLENFERDMTSLAADMRTTLQGVADRRFEKLKAQRDLDSKRSFPIS